MTVTGCTPVRNAEKPRGGPPHWRNRMKTLKELIDKQHEAARAAHEMASTYGTCSDEHASAHGIRAAADAELRTYIRNLIDMPGNPEQQF